MFLCIDTTLNNKIVLYYSEDTGWQKIVRELAPPQALLGIVEEVLRSHGQGQAALQGLAVVVGQGSFTATRVAVTVGNTLALAWGKPIVALLDSAMIYQVPELISQRACGQYILPIYSGEPRIGARLRTV